MNEKIKQLWLEALPNYEQTKLQLRRDHSGYDDDKDVSIPAGFCCLGVLADVCIKNKLIDAEWEDEYLKLKVYAGYDKENDEYDPEDYYSHEEVVLPYSVRQVVMLEGSEGNLPFKDRHGMTVTLAAANDSGCTFAQIADLIRYFL